MNRAIRPVSAPLSLTLLGLCGLLFAMTARSRPASAEDSVDAPVKLMTLDPGHFHAGLVQKEMYPGVSPIVHVYAPLGPDLIAHLQRIAQFNRRESAPTRWQLEVHAGPDFAERLLKERPGNVVVISGRNRGKMDRILAAVQNGLSVLADKPWIIDSADLPKLETALDTAEKKGLVAYDMMTERHEITTILQRELVGDAAILGVLLKGSEADPAVAMESVHNILKTVAGAPNVRPAWFFDTAEQGEGLADIGTHLVDLVPWILFPDQAIDARRDVHLVSARRWPTPLSPADFQRVTGLGAFPANLGSQVKEGQLQFQANTQVSYTLRGIHTRLKVIWAYEGPRGVDTHFAQVRGSRSRIEIRQGAAEDYRPELFVVPNTPADHANVASALKARLGGLEGKFPGLSVEEKGQELRLAIPDRYRVGHEAHFAQVTARFLDYLKDPRTVPAWEKANMRAKYEVTTGGVELSQGREGGGR
jgi:predicted dehydrogenase